MSYVIKLVPIVHTDLKKAKKWYNKHREELGE